MPSDSDTISAADEQDTDIQQTGEPATTDSTASDAAPAEQAEHGEQPSTEAPATTNADPAAPLTTTQQTQTETKPPEPSVDWEKRYRDQQSWIDRQTSQWKQRMEGQERQMSELAKWKQEQEQRAQAAQLKPWSKAHPENTRFNGLLERAKVVDQQLRQIPASLPPEQQEAMRNAIIGVLSPDEQKQIGDYRESLQSFQKDFFTDPHGTLLPMVEQLAEQKVQQVLAKIEAQQSVQRDFADPTIAPLVQEYGKDMKQAIEDGVPYQYTVHMMKMYDELRKAKEELGKASGKTAHASEQMRLIKGGASTTRDPRSPPPDPYTAAKAEALKKGIDLASPAFSAILAKHSA